MNAHVLHKESGSSMPTACFRERVKGLLRRRQIHLTPPPRFYCSFLQIYTNAEVLHMYTKPELIVIVHFLLFACV